MKGNTSLKKRINWTIVTWEREFYNECYKNNFNVQIIRLKKFRNFIVFFTKADLLSGAISVHKLRTREQSNVLRKIKNSNVCRNVWVNWIILKLNKNPQRFRNAKKSQGHKKWNQVMSQQKRAPPISLSVPLRYRRTFTAKLG